MFYSPKVYWKDHWIHGSAAIWLAFEVFMWIYAAIYVRPTTEQVFLHYNVVFGVDLIGEWWQMLAACWAGLIFFVINFGLSWYVYGQDKILARFLTVITAGLNAFLAMAFYLVVGLNS
ncbi:MAG: hypothetical protein ACD_72C00075G0001 [uncultured bacterium]|nr:MAG: hypothetical protein ACD_72C00075G0001 [uncultured bacterium]